MMPALSAKLHRALQTRDADIHHDIADVHDSDTLGLRVASIFIVLTAGLLGGIPPLLIKEFRNQDSLAAQMARALSAGVILALGLVHIIPEGIEDLGELPGINYPLGAVCVLAGVALMLLLEHTAHMLHSHQRHQHLSSTTIAVASACPQRRTGDDVEAATRKPERQQPLLPCAADEMPNQAKATACQKPDASVNMGLPGSTCPAEGDAIKTYVAGSAPQLHGGATGPCSPSPGDVLRVALSQQQHEHTCVSFGTGPGLVALAGGTAARCPGKGDDSDGDGDDGGRLLRLRMLAYLFELGCVFHSVIIGISLGVIKFGFGQVRALLLALAFHQWLEGAGLGAFIVSGGFSYAKGGLMVLGYALTCPLGIAIGIGIAETYDSTSTLARAVQGSLNGVSGGMLLYIALVQLIAEDLGRLTAGRGAAARRMVAFVAFCFGAGSMCLLAIWA